MLILNDIHIGFQRKGGTTPKSREALRGYLLTRLATLLEETEEADLLVNGDLFDDFEVEGRDWVAAYQIFSKWLKRGGGLILAAGNHDHSPRAAKVSSFQMLAEVLKGYGPMLTVVEIDQVHWINPKACVVAHCSNQDMFELRLNEVREKIEPNGVVFLHANYDNKFAAQTDHSLNVSHEVAKKFRDEKSATLVFAHEHQARQALSGRVLVMGNQWPTSVADCLNNDHKAYHLYTPEGGIERGEITWAADGPNGFHEVDWRELGTLTAGFVRITGQASAQQAGDVITAIAKYRSSSDAFVIVNAVKIEGMAEIEKLPETFDAVKSFDVLEFISRHVDPQEMEVVRSLMQ